MAGGNISPRWPPYPRRWSPKAGGTEKERRFAMTTPIPKTSAQANTTQNNLTNTTKYVIIQHNISASPKQGESAVKRLFFVLILCCLSTTGCAVLPATMAGMSASDAGDMYTSAKNMPFVRRLDTELTIIELMHGDLVPGQHPIAEGEANPLIDTITQTNYPSPKQYAKIGALEVVAQTGIIVATLPIPPLSLSLAALFTSIGLLDMKCNHHGIAQAKVFEEYLVWTLSNGNRLFGEGSREIKVEQTAQNTTKVLNKTSFSTFLRQIGADVLVPVTC